ncbi:MAG: electron transfer flavoprotein subunit beta/FixA family protein [Gammaproteobacteria bacterium]|nr:electron transfer flavoprotein subunit beta/FixA family protein [Gammaproteobacteria bacterium]MCG3143227.1 Electron transfer flavoprotein subunit beta [Gammaproteobacteria bacterium]
MRILVCVKQVLNLDDEFELRADGLDVDRDYCDRDLNEWDDYALEEALRIRERGGGDIEVVAATVGAEDATAELRKCLAKGADRGVRVWDERLQDCDGMMIAHVLAALVRREQPALVLTGVQGADHGQAQTGVALAALLAWPRAAVVRALEFSADAGEALVRRELEGGLEECVRIRCPAVLTIQVGINTPRYASLRGITQAAGRSVDTPALAELAIDGAAIAAARAARVRRMYVPPRPRPRMIEGRAGEQAAALAALIRDIRGGPR